MLLNYNPLACLPSAEELPDSDDTPVDNELQDLIPHVLKDTLALIWAERMDWFFGVDMGIYYNPEQPMTAIVPDGFLSIGVPRIIDSDLRLSYVLWDEKVIPMMTLEVVSQTRRGEYTEKKEDYAKMGILYYVIYNPLRKRKPRLEVYELQNGVYKLLEGEPLWLSQIGLGIGREIGIYHGVEREWLYWYDQQGKRYLTPEQRAIEAEKEALEARQQALASQNQAIEARNQATEAQRQALEARQQALASQSQAIEAQEKAKKLEAKLRSLGIDPNKL